MIKISNLKLDISAGEDELRRKVIKILRLSKFVSGEETAKFDIRILKKSLDARNKPELFYVYTVAVSLKKSQEEKILNVVKAQNVSEFTDEKYNPIINLKSEAVYCVGEDGLNDDSEVVIVGAGPAGLFCAYILALNGYRPHVVERGESVSQRSVTVQKFFEEGILNSESNVQFGEGGAGTFSDGKLNTMVKDRAGRNQFVLDTFVKLGAKESIAYDSKPHVGTDELKKIVVNLRNEIISLGGKFSFNCKMTDIVIDGNRAIAIKVNDGKIIKTKAVVLAIGHSARETFQLLKNKNFKLEQKNFAVGLRCEHPQSLINSIQYGSENADFEIPADYKLTNQTSNGRSVYSFCMCPGGYVVNASSEEGKLCVNGMSYSARDSKNANSALICSVDTADFGGVDPLLGMEFQRRLEEKAYRLCNGKIPVQRFADFRDNVVTKKFGEVTPSMKGAYDFANLRELFNEDINDAIIESFEKFGYTMKGFALEDAIFSGVESRTSSPVRIVRDENCLSSVCGIYPCGEGAGYAGGIMSAAIDGIKVAEAVIATCKNSKNCF